MKRVYLSLGSNLGDREQMLRQAVALLEAPDFHVLRVTSVYETEPVDRLAQPWFLNLVLEAETSLLPKLLLARVQKVERRLGRRRGVSKGPRTIDIDILLYGQSVVGTTELTIPHPRMSERRFVLEPLAELAPELRHPLSRRSVGELLPATAGQAVRKARER
ncbi:MAG: 2-amino-4-hydroxy-6-hydroxymethyldihydropteridine diphosphokinase [Acidobacteriota bacterium]